MLQQIDVAILVWIQNNLRSDVMTPVWQAITMLGNGGWFWIVLGVGLLFYKKTRPVGLAVLVSLGIGALITNVGLKNMVARIRPYDYTDAILRLLPAQHDFSFPSGHTCASFAAALVCYHMLPGKYGIPALLLAAMIAFSRLYLGVHYPTDILGGFLAAVVSSILAFSLVEWLMARWKIRQQS